MHRVDPPFVIIAPAIPNGPAAGLHLAISDATGDSHIFVYVKVKLFIHHGRQYKVMTNFPTFDEQLALNAYWNNIGGNRFMPGTINAADRFVRTTCYLNSPRNTKLPNLRWLGHSRRSECSACVPLGMSDEQNPNLAMTLWRTVVDHKTKVLYFESAIFPSVSWGDMSKLDLNEGAKPKMVRVKRGHPLAGELPAVLKPAEPFKWLGAN